MALQATLSQPTQTQPQTQPATLLPDFPLCLDVFGVIGACLDVQQSPWRAGFELQVLQQTVAKQFFDYQAGELCDSQVVGSPLTAALTKLKPWNPMSGRKAEGKVCINFDALYVSFSLKLWKLKFSWPKVWRVWWELERSSDLKIPLQRAKFESFLKTLPSDIRWRPGPKLLTPRP